MSDSPPHKRVGATSSGIPITTGGLAEMVPFDVPRDDRGKKYLRLKTTWAEWFYRMEEIGVMHCWSSNGWGTIGRYQNYARWQRVPDGPRWINLHDESEINMNAMDSIIVAEDSCGAGFSLSVQVLHRNGHGHIKLLLTHESDFQAFRSLVQTCAVAQPLDGIYEAAVTPTCGENPCADRNKLQSLWPGACRAMPLESFAGIAGVTRYQALQKLGSTYAEQVCTKNFDMLVLQWIKYHCQIDMRLYHCDHITATSFLPTELLPCNSCWHVYGDNLQCHMAKDPSVQLWRVKPVPDDDTDPGWLEFYHQPSHRMLAWVRPSEQSDAVNWLHWKKSMDELF